MIQAVIFDLDGLMIDTEALHSEAHAMVIRKYGKSPKKYPNDMVHVVGKSIKENSEIIRDKYNIDQVIEILEKEKDEAYLFLLKSKTISIMPGFKTLLILLAKYKIKAAIGSSGVRKGIFIILKKLGLENKFSVIISKENVKRAKPAPDIFLLAAKKLKVSPKYCLVLEDSQSGVEAGKNAGMKVIAVPNKYTSYQDFSKADKIVKSLNDVTLSLIKNL